MQKAKSHDAGWVPRQAQWGRGPGEGPRPGGDKGVRRTPDQNEQQSTRARAQLQLPAMGAVDGRHASDPPIWPLIGSRAQGSPLASAAVSEHF